MESKEWFADWFDTSYYHTLYANRNDVEAAEFISNLVNFLQIEGNSSVLDLACGKGRHSITLNKLGFSVLGVDLSPNSIEAAKHHETENLRFSVHDMREVLVGQRFDAIFNLFTSFGYFDTITENEKVVQSMHEMLVENGFLIIDFMNAQKVIDTLVIKESKTIDGITFELERFYDGSHVFKEIRFEDKGKKFHFTERVQALKKEDFEQLLLANKFEILHTFGDFSLSNFNTAQSDRLIILAKKI
jgi:2-polyprenyl-3-methyl-5-hydroxy-6-metoxy-1,4-benzoquinol methylase